MKMIERIEVFAQLGAYLDSLLNSAAQAPELEAFEALLVKAENHNRWFSRENMLLAMGNIVDMLGQEALQTWLAHYPDLEEETSSKRIGVIMAGNIPMVGFHDFLCVLITGNTIVVKLSSNDRFLLPFVAQKLITIHKGFEDRIVFEENRLTDFDAIIATGSNNSARYFDYYFGKYPHIIRKNRNSVALLTGDESKEELQALAKDVFYYFGLGCRNVSKLLLPEGYDIPSLLDEFQGFQHIQQHAKYLNNYEYNKSLLLINKEPHFDNGFLILQERAELATPAAVLNYEFYTDIKAELTKLSAQNDQIQCLVSGEGVLNNAVSFGEAQSPGLMDYADNVDVVSFLSALKK